MRLAEWLAVDPRPMLLYKTATVCGRCMVGDGRPLEMHGAQVVARAHAVHLEFACPRHGPQTTPYCSDLFFFERALAWQLPGGVPSSRAVDMEDLGRRLTLQHPEAVQPAVMELAVVGGPAAAPLPIAQVLAALAQLKKAQRDKRFVVRCAAKVPNIVCCFCPFPLASINGL